MLRFVLTLLLFQQVLAWNAKNKLNLRNKRILKIKLSQQLMQAIPKFKICNRKTKNTKCLSKIFKLIYNCKEISK